jgi:uncharacterized protein
MAQSQISDEKRKEIEKMVRLTGMEKQMNQLKVQAIAALRTRNLDLPEGFWARVEEKMDMHQLIEKMVPVYDGYYSTEELKAVNAFYESPVGQKVLSTTPKIIQEGRKIGQEWGEKIGRLAAEEAEKAKKGSDGTRKRAQ